MHDDRFNVRAYRDAFVVKIELSIERLDQSRRADHLDTDDGFYFEGAQVYGLRSFGTECCGSYCWSRPKDWRSGVQPITIKTRCATDDAPQASLERGVYLANSACCRTGRVMVNGGEDDNPGKLCGALASTAVTEQTSNTRQDGFFLHTCLRLPYRKNANRVVDCLIFSIRCLHTKPAFPR